MIYSTGTITVSGNTITGTGTNFQAAGALIRTGCTLLTLSNPMQAFQITAINSATSLTVTPAASPALAAGTKYAILVTDSLSVDGLANNVAYSLDLFNKNMGGFADVMNGVGDVTITINGTGVTVPGQKSLAKKGANTDITSLGGLTTALSVPQGGTGANTAAGARTSLGISDEQLTSVNNKSGGTITGSVNIEGLALNLRATSAGGGWPFFITFMAGQGNNLAYTRLYQENSGDMTIATGMATGTNKYFQFNAAGNMNAPGTITCVSLTQTSDRDKKTDIEPISNPLDRVRKLDGMTYIMRDTGVPSAGVIAQDVLKVLPEAVGSVFEDNDEYADVPVKDKDGKPVLDDAGNVVTETQLIRRRDESRRSYTVEYSGVIALCVAALKELDQTVTALDKNQRNMAAFLQTMGFDHDTDYTEREPEPENQ